MTRNRRKSTASLEANYHSLEPRLLLAVDTLPPDIVGTPSIDIIEVVVRSDNVRVTVNNDVTNFDPALVDRVVIDGAGGRDRITIIDEAAADNQTRICPDSVRVDGLVDIYAKNVGDIVVQAGDGNDVARIIGSDLNEFVVVEPGSTFLGRSGFTSRVIGFDETFVDAGRGDDSVFIADTAGEETLIAGANDARLIYTDSLVAFNQFDNIYATFSEGNDLVALNGSDGDDNLYATPELARLFIAETQTTIRATGFGRVVANGGGGVDQVNFMDSPLNDRLLVRPGFASLTTPFSAVVINVGDFENINAFANNGGHDVGAVFDTGGNDRFHAGPLGARMIGPGYSVNLIDFERVDAIASEGDDHAHVSNFVGASRFTAGHGDVLFGSANAGGLSISNFDLITAAGSLEENDTAFILGTFGDDELYGSLLQDESGISTSAIFIGSGTLMSLTDFFDVEVSTGFRNETNSAYLKSSTSNGTFDGSPDESSITGPQTPAGLSKLTVKGFNNVIGSFAPVATNVPTMNFAELSGSPGDDSLYARRHFGLLNTTSVYRGDVSIVVNGADHLSSSGKGGNDSAILQDTDADEIVFLNPDVVHMQALDGVNNGGYDLFAHNFESVIVNTSGGFDQASFSGSDGNDIFFADSTRSSMRGDGFYLQGLGFESSTGIALTGSQDIAYVYDSPGNDFFTGEGNRGVLRGSSFVNRVFGFDEVHAVSVNGGVDELSVGSIDYKLFQVGDWN